MGSWARARSRACGHDRGGAGPDDHHLRRAPAGPAAFASAIVAISQSERACATATVLLDSPQPDIIRHDQWTGHPAAGPEAAYPADMPMRGRQLRIEGIREYNSPDEVGPPVMDAWLHYDVVPERDDMSFTQDGMIRAITQDGMIRAITQDGMIRAITQDGMIPGDGAGRIGGAGTRRIPAVRPEKARPGDGRTAR